MARFYLNFLTIAAVAFAVYFPSFAHTFRADQIYYFANTRNCDDVGCMWRNFYAYEHTRYYYPGDTYLCRPLLNLLLGLEKGLFGMHYAYWHLLGFAFHMLTVWFLFKILYDLKGGIFALLGCLAFACSFANTEMVIWEHINGYELFNAMVLASFYYFKKSYVAQKNRRAALYIVVALLVCCAFLHEFGSVFALMFGACFYFKNREVGRLQDNKKTWLFLLPGFCYAMVYLAINFRFPNAKLPGTLHQVFQFSNLLHTAAFIPHYFYHLVKRGLLPCAYGAGLNFMGRLVFVPRPAHSVWFAANAVAVLGVLCFVVQGLRGPAGGRNMPFLLLVAGMAAFVDIAVPLFRMQTHGESYVLDVSSYYSYMFWSYVLVMLYLGIDCTGGGGGREALRLLATASMMVLVFLNGFQTWTLNQALKRKASLSREYIDQINDFIARHGHEQGFSFFVHNDAQIVLNRWVKGSADELLDRDEIYYNRYYNAVNPEYTLYFYKRDGRYVMRALQRRTPK